MSYAGLEKVATSLDRLAKSVRENGQTKVPRTKQEFAYQMMLAAAQGGASSSRLSNLRDDIDEGWETLQSIGNR